MPNSRTNSFINLTFSKVAAGYRGFFFDHLFNLNCLR